MRNTILLLSAALILVSCSNMKKENGNDVMVARAGDRALYLSEIPSSLFADGMSSTDSISALQSYIRRWARKELMAIKAEQNLTVDYKSEVNRQLDEMRNNLLIYQYEQQMLLQRLDTNVTESEVQEYYISNISTFTLTTNLVKALFIKIPADAPDLDKVRKLYRSNTSDDLRALDDYCYQFAVRYDDFNEEWIPFTQLLMEVPLESGDQEGWLKRNNAVELKDDKFVYFINIREYRLARQTAPIEYISGQVKTIILNNRRNDFLQKLEDGIYNEAIRDNTLKVY